MNKIPQNVVGKFAVSLYDSPNIYKRINRQKFIELLFIANSLKM